MPSAWFEEFFSGIVNEFWERCISPEQTSAEVDMLERYLNCRSGRILDIPCGNGRHALELAGRGHLVTGVDISSEFITKARCGSEQLRRRVEWICGDMRKFSRAGEFDAAFSLGNSFGYLEHEDTIRFLESIARALKPRGRFFLQAGIVAECLLPRFRDREWHEVDGMLFLEENRYDIDAGCVVTAYTFVQDGKVERRQGKQYLYTVAEIRRLLANAGLRPLQLFGPSENHPFQLSDPVVHLVAEKA